MSKTVLITKEMMDALKYDEDTNIKEELSEKVSDKFTKKTTKILTLSILLYFS